MSLSPSLLILLGIVKGELVLEVSAQAQQQQDVHSEQIEAEQQRGALAGAEGHSEHPHQTGAASSSLLEGAEKHKVTGNIWLICLYFHGD